MAILKKHEGGVQAKMISMGVSLDGNSLVIVLSDDKQKQIHAMWSADPQTMLKALDKLRASAVQLMPQLATGMRRL